jgi:hypothetical protein
LPQVYYGEHPLPVYQIGDGAIRGRSNVDSDLAREFRTQKAAVPWAAIALPEIRFASQSLLKAGFRKALQVVSAIGAL